MTSVGIDCALDCTKRGAWIQTNGNEFVGRYYRISASKWVPLASTEARVLSKAKSSATVATALSHA
jgi:hypothetical protein